MVFPMLDIIRAILALLLIFFIPGFMIVNAIFPRKGELDVEMDMLYRGALAIGLSIVVTIMAGFFLNAFGVNPDTGEGYFSTIYITMTLVVVSLIGFFAGWWRGAYQFMGNWHSKLIRPTPQDPKSLTGPMLRDKKRGFEHRQLAEEKFKTIDRIGQVEKNEAMHEGDTAKYYRDKRLALQDKLREIEAKMVELEQQEDLY